MELRVGSRWKSVACTTEVVVVRAAQQKSLECGGHPMAPSTSDVPRDATVDSAFRGDGTRVGKRYVDHDAGIEVLCISGGDGALSVDGRLLSLKATAALPASD